MPHQAEINDQQQLLQIHHPTLAKYLEQKAMIGDPYVSPAVLHGIREARSNIHRIKEILRSWCGSAGASR
jgi:hypothetical protein